MITENNIGKKTPYTYKEIIEIEYPDVWELARGCLTILENWQNMLVELLPLNKRLIPDYLKLRSIFGLSHFIWDKVNLYCHELAYCANNQNQTGIGEAQEKLYGIFDAFAKIDIFDIIEDKKTGFKKLEQVVGGFGDGTDFPVFDCWSFLDIVGTVRNNGWGDVGLCTAANHDTIPSGKDLIGFMESDEDNRMIRIY